MLLRPAVLLVAIATVAAPRASAQGMVQAGRGSVSTQVRVGLVIPPRLKVRVAQHERVAQRGDTTTWAMHVEVAANLEWTLNAAPSDAADHATLLVRDEHGAWRALRAGEPMVALVSDQQPGNWRPVRIEVQVVGARGPRTPPALTLDLQPALR